MENQSSSVFESENAQTDHAGDESLHSKLAASGQDGTEKPPVDQQDSRKLQEVEDDADHDVKAELAEFKDRYVRLMADVENMRRRMEREKVDLMKYALEGFFKDLLPALDSLEKALPSGVEGHTEHASDAYFAGMVMVKRQLIEILKKHGLEIVQAKGVEFDPNVHQAIQRIESNEAQKDMVKDEYALGYTLHGRLLRPAMVSVLTPSGAE